MYVDSMNKLFAALLVDMTGWSAYLEVYVQTGKDLTSQAYPVEMWRTS